MKATNCFFIIYVLFISLANSEQRSDWLLKEKSPDNLKIPLPGGREYLEFSYVSVEKTTSSYSSVEFLIGKDANSLESPISYAYVSGSVYRDGTWYLPVGTSEITNAQYAAVMGENDNSAGKGEFPKTNISRVEAMLFVEKVNQYLFKEQKDLLKNIEGNHKGMKMHGLPFVRMMSEMEWEYCARGGRRVSSDVFESPTPYSSSTEDNDPTLVYDYENVDTGDGTASLLPVKKKKPNPCGLYDMLGNVSEWVLQDFQQTYTVGRLGGALVRGGSWNVGSTNMQMDLDSFAAYARNEFQPYTEQGIMFRSPNIGFRVALGSKIMVAFSDEYEKKLMSDATNWQSTHKIKITESVKSTNSEILTQDANKLVRDQVKLEEKSKDTRKALEKASQNLPSGEAQKIKGLSDKLASLEAEVQHQQNRANQFENLAKAAKAEAIGKSLDAGVMLFSASCGYASKDFVKLQNLKKLILEIGESPEYVTKIKDLEANIADFYRNFQASCEVLSQMDESLVQEALKREKGKVKKNQAQVFSMEAGITCYEHYRKNRRWNDQVFIMWKNALLEHKN